MPLDLNIHFHIHPDRHNNSARHVIRTILIFLGSFWVLLALVFSGLYLAGGGKIWRNRWKVMDQVGCWGNETSIAFDRIDKRRYGIRFVYKKVLEANARKKDLMFGLRLNREVEKLIKLIENTCLRLSSELTEDIFLAFRIVFLPPICDIFE